MMSRTGRSPHHDRANTVVKANRAFRARYADEAVDVGDDRLVGDRLLTTTEAARALGISPRSLSRWAREGRVTPAMNTAGGDQRSGRYLWDLDDLRNQLLHLRTRDRTVEE
jgi:hypothetical protein